ncbi:MAG: 3-isopropylmalate dehydratase small subunit [Oscillospiraceae bacterium]|nr:3-isopropylmalate dehydratase small subunit [Oscillospiraceae bacterium]
MGIVHKYGDNVDTDVIVPGKYLSLNDPKALASICMEGIDPEFPRRVKEGDVMVGGANFGCGSSREHAPIGIKAAGISCIIAESFARIFYRNSINLGLPVLEAPEAAREISAGDEVTVDMAAGIIRNRTTGREYAFVPFPPSIMQIILAGGIKAKLLSDAKK